MSPWDGHMTYQIYPNIATWHVSVTPLLDVAASLRLQILRVFLDSFELDKILHCHQSGVLPTCKHQDIPFRSTYQLMQIGFGKCFKNRLVTSMRATCSAAKSWTICSNSSWRLWDERIWKVGVLDSNICLGDHTFERVVEHYWCLQNEDVWCFL